MRGAADERRVEELAREHNIQGRTRKLDQTIGARSYGRLRIIRKGELREHRSERS